MKGGLRSAALALGLLLAASASADTVFTITLNVNYYQDATADRVAPAIRRHLILMRKHGFRADYTFTWLAARMVAERDPGLFAELEAAGMGIGHHGANRPPHPNPIELVQGKSWDAAVAAVREYESHDVDPATGALLPSLGGLLGLRTLYGLTPLATGRFVRAPVLLVAEEHGARMMVGLASNVGASSAEAWFMGALNRPEHADLTVEPDAYDPKDGTQGAAAVAALASALATRSDGLHFGALLVHDSEFVGGSIQNMRASGVPDSRNEAYWRAYETIVAYLAARPEVRVRTQRQIFDAAIPEGAITAQELALAASNLAAASTLPLFVETGDRRLSLARALIALEETVAAAGSGAAAPATAGAVSVLGPRAEAPASLGTLSLSRPDLVRAAASSAGRDGSFIRSTVTVGGRTLNAAEYLTALARLVASGYPSEVRVEGLSLFPDGTGAVQDALTRLQFWTYEPARFAVERLR
ncbi:MAG TPA: hypothetical protein VJU18_01190 [Vicinamibacteria bacterium]|nr:hypothetical protein [Vicinamibacteria bacterium]